MALGLVKRCPACGAEHPPQTLRCACGALLAGVDLSEAASAEAARDTRPSTANDDPAELGPFCPHADCGQRNAAAALRCVYCNRAMTLPASTFFIRWPWGEHGPLGAELLIGRVPPAPAALIERLEQHYDNVSRRHALLRFDRAQLTVEDLGSANGTFVNEVRLPAHQPVRLHRGATLRFGADLSAAIDDRP